MRTLLFVLLWPTLLSANQQLRVGPQAPFPTISEALKEAAEDAYGLSLHNPPKQ